MSTMPNAAAESLLTVVERGVVRVPYQTGDFESAVRGLLVSPLLATGVSPARIDEIIHCVLTREAAGSTCAGAIALPHARTAGIPMIVAGLGVNRQSIHPGGASVMLAFVSPLDAAAVHLRFLSAAAKAFRDAAFLDRLQAAATAEGVLALLRDAG